MLPQPEFLCHRTRFDEDYQPASSTRLTTNFANLARGEHRQRNLRNTIKMINSRFNELAHWDNPRGDRYAVELDIISVEMRMPQLHSTEGFPLIEILQTHVFDKRRHQRLEGITGNSFSSYIRDYDFSVRLPQFNAQRSTFSEPDDFGDLHGLLFKQFVRSNTYAAQFNKPPVICISVSTSKTYTRTHNTHPILGVEYQQSELSATDRYFAKMGMRVRFFMPPRSTAPLAIYFQGDLLNDYTNLELISTISTMETFQRIYRPEIYNANAAAGAQYQASLQHTDHSLTQIDYDRVERSQLAIKQGQFTEANFIQPNQHVLDQWAAQAQLMAA